MADDKDAVKAVVAQEISHRAAEMQERQRNQSQLGLAALRGLTIVNGGSIVALFTFIGGNSAAFDPNNVWWGFSFFVAGIALALASTLLAYISEGRYSEYQFQEVWWAYAALHDRDPSPYQEKGKKARRVGTIFSYSSLGCSVSSLLCFVSGAAFVLSGVLAR